MDEQGNPVWPELFPIEKIQKIRETVGERHFSAQMMLNYVPSDKIRFDPGKMKIYDGEFDWHTGRIDGNTITGATIYWDPSSGRRHADNSVCVLVYRDDNTKRVFIHDILYMIVPETIEYPLSYQCELAINFVKKYKMHSIYIETNGIGGALPEIMRNITTHTEYNIQIRSINNSRHKETRILDAIEPLISSGRLYAHGRITQTPVISEMLAWTPIGSSEHDDGMDAIAGAIACAPNPIRPLGAMSHHYTANTNFKI